MKKTFRRIITVWYAFYSKVATFTDFEKSLFLEKKTNFVRFSEILLFQSHSTANFLQFGDKNLSNSESEISVEHFQMANKRKENFRDDFSSLL